MSFIYRLRTVAELEHLNSKVITILAGNTLLAQEEALVTTQKPSCSIFRDLGKNDLSINDIVVKSADSNLVCIKARFSLAIKVEEPVGGLNENLDSNEPPSEVSTENNLQVGSNDLKVVLGYLPLDSVTSVIDSCPKPKDKSSKQASTNGTDATDDEDDELEMIVIFECGKLAFSFKRDEKYYVSSIRGVVNLDSNIAVPYISDKPGFYTSDLNHHFKYNDLVEIGSRAKTKAFILTANFYHTEFEVFRATSSRDFIKPPDDNSKPLNEEDPVDTATT